MIVLSDFRLRPLQGLGWVLVMVWLGMTGRSWAQSSLDASAVVPPASRPPLEKPWPTEDGILRGEILPILPGNAAIEEFSLQSNTAGSPLRLGAEEGLGPVADLSVPLPGAGHAAASKRTQDEDAEVRPSQLGNVSFNRMAQSFNLGKAEDDVPKNDLSRQLGKVSGPRNVVATSPITGWAVIGLILLVIVIALVIGQHENDNDDRKRRKKVRRRRHHHSS